MILKTSIVVASECSKLGDAKVLFSSASHDDAL